MKAFIVLVLVLLTACGGHQSDKDASTPADSSPGDDATLNDGDMIFTDAAEDNGGLWHEYDGGYGCLKDAAYNPYALETCCADGSICQGECVENDKGVVQCTCWGLANGCQGGLVCCTITSSCISTMYCNNGK